LALTVRLDEMRAKAKERAHMENGGPLTDAEWNDRINSGIRRLYRLLAQVFGSEYFKKSSSPTTTANVKTVNLPSDFFKLVSLWWDSGSGVAPHRMRRATEEEMERQIAGQGWGAWGWRSSEEDWPKYALRAGTIEFIPTPDNVYTLTLNYIAAPTKLVADDNTFDGYGGFEELPI
jgi:hypothetical protein